jgi:hypothetical protein
MNSRRGLLRLWLAGSVIWVVFWAWHSDAHCNLGIRFPWSGPWCDDCGNGLRVNLGKLATKVGRDFNYIGSEFPLRCPLCASGNVSTRISSAPPAGNPPEVLYAWIRGKGVDETRPPLPAP